VKSIFFRQPLSSPLLSSSFVLLSMSNGHPSPLQPPHYLPSSYYLKELPLKTLCKTSKNKDQRRDLTPHTSQDLHENYTALQADYTSLETDYEKLFEESTSMRKRLEVPF
jgi:hypothetical protein